MNTSSIPGAELIQVADIVAREKSIDREEVIIAMEQAIQKAGRSRYGQERDIRPYRSQERRHHARAGHRSGRGSRR